MKDVLSGTFSSLIYIASCFIANKNGCGATEKLNKLNRLDAEQVSDLPLRCAQCLGKLRRNCSKMKRKMNEASQRKLNSSNEAGYINLIIHLLLLKEKKRCFSAKPC